MAHYYQNYAGILGSALIMVLSGDSGHYEVSVSVSNKIESSASVAQPVPASSRIYNSVGKTGQSGKLVVYFFNRV